MKNLILVIALISGLSLASKQDIYPIDAFDLETFEVEKRGNLIGYARYEKRSLLYRIQFPSGNMSSAILVDDRDFPGDGIEVWLFGSLEPDYKLFEEFEGSNLFNIIED
ncbi:MAG: hypothetical protein ACJARG_000063 [Arcticibacterium sp.]|jgi:hypothetical protein